MIRLCQFWEKKSSKCEISGWDTLGIKHDEGKYKHTVDLPNTTFGMRANSSVREPELQKLWEDNEVFKKIVDRNDGVSVTSYVFVCLFICLLADWLMIN